MRGDSPAGISLDVLRYGTGDDLARLVKFRKLSVQAILECFSIVVAMVPFPCVLPIQNNREQSVRLPLTGCTTHNMADEIIRRRFSFIVLVHETDFNGEFRIPEYDRHR